MTPEEKDCSGLTEPIKTLLVVLNDLQRAAHVFDIFEQFASASWGADSYSCFDWIALSRRMFRKPLLALKELARNHRKEEWLSIEWCYERTTAITDRLWYERSMGPKEIVATVHNVMARIHLAMNGKGRNLVDNGDLMAFEFLLDNSAEGSRRYRPTSDQVLADPSASFWLKNALRSALTRGPIDAANDSEVLMRILNSRCQDALDMPANVVGGRSAENPNMRGPS